MTNLVVPYCPQVCFRICKVDRRRSLCADEYLHSVAELHCELYFCSKSIQGRFIHVAATAPTTDWSCEITVPWWNNPKYVVRHLGSPTTGLLHAHSNRLKRRICAPHSSVESAWQRLAMSVQNLQISSCHHAYPGVFRRSNDSMRVSCAPCTSHFFVCSCSNSPLLCDPSCTPAQLARTLSLHMLHCHCGIAHVYALQPESFHKGK